MSETNQNSADDSQGMALYEYIVNNVDTCAEEMDSLICDLKKADSSGQFLASTARFLAAVDREKFEDVLPQLIEAAIEKDRERRYIGQLLEAIWGKDYAERVETLRAEDDVFRRLYKRVFPTGVFD